MNRVFSLLNKIKNKYKINLIDKKNYKSKIFYNLCIFEHENSNFKILDYSDRDYPDKCESKYFLESKQCQYVLKCQYNPIWQQSKFRPFFYFEKHDPEKFSTLSDKLRNKKNRIHKIFWKGNLGLGRRDILEKMSSILNEDYLHYTDKKSFYEETSNYKMAISLPGLGKSCHREFECFALGTVVVAPVFKNIYHIPLVPNFHYIAIEETEPERIAEAALDIFYTIKNEEIEFIKKNALDYYDSYIKFESSIKWMEHLLEL